MARAASAAVLGWLLAAGCGPSVAEQFKRAEDQGTVEGWRTFIQANPEAPERDKALERMDEVAFTEAKEAGTTEAYDVYLEEFPEGAHADEVLAAQDDLAWEAAKKDGDLAAYLEDWDDGSHVGEAKAMQEEQAFAEAAKGGKDALRAILEKRPDSKHAAKAWEQLEKAIVDGAGDAGIILWHDKKDGKLTGIRSLAGNAGGEVLTLKAVNLGLGKGPLKAKKGRVTLKGSVEFGLVDDEYPEDPVGVVVLLRAEGFERILSAPLKVKVKKVLKKKGGKAKVALKTEAEGLAAEGKAHVFLVTAEVGDDPAKLRPVTNIVTQDYAVAQ